MTSSTSGTYAVIFTSKLRQNAVGYEAAAQRMMELVAKQPGYLGADSVRGADGIGITISYWESEQAILGWKTTRLIRQRGPAAGTSGTSIFTSGSAKSSANTALCPSNHR